MRLWTRQSADVAVVNHTGPVRAETAHIVEQSTGQNTSYRTKYRIRGEMHRTGVHSREDSTDCGTLVSPSGNIILTRCGNKTQFGFLEKMSLQMIVS